MKCYKKAFTMIELIMIIVVVGILAVAVIPRVDRDTLVEATNQVASHIRYTQHLAMMDDKYDPKDSTWYKSRWQIYFTKGAGSDNIWSYSIFSDFVKGKTGNPDVSELAKNPQNPSKFLTGGFGGTVGKGDSRISPELNIGKKYGITNVEFTGGCSGGQRLAFDEVGRPYGTLTNADNPVKGLLKSDCIIKLSDGGNKKGIITISAETGYVTSVIK